ncbi:MAG: flippase-like domain-containing protein, partial [Myxococcales bacterium]|nr:flippase-like domain-containing protein [Myxococcales bacterium]
MHDEANTAAAEPSSSARLIRGVFVVTLLGTVVYGVLVVANDAKSVGAALAQFRWSAFGMALLLVTGNYVLRFARWELYLRALGLRIPTFDSALIFTSGFTMSVTPGKLGEVFKSALLREAHGVPVERTAPIVLAERLTDLIALVLIASVGCLRFPFGIAIAGTGAAACALAGAACVHRGFGLFAVRTLARLPVLRRFDSELHRAFESLHAVSSVRAMLAAATLATVGWSLEAIACHGILHGFPGTHIGWTDVCFAYAASQIAGALAFVPGGLGVTEAGMAGFLRATAGGGVSGATAASATVLTRLATLWWA